MKQSDMAHRIHCAPIAATVRVLLALMVTTSYARAAPPPGPLGQPSPSLVGADSTTRVAACTRPPEGLNHVDAEKSVRDSLKRVLALLQAPSHTKDLHSDTRKWMTARWLEGWIFLGSRLTRMSSKLGPQSTDQAKEIYRLIGKDALPEGDSLLALLLRIRKELDPTLLLAESVAGWESCMTALTRLPSDAPIKRGKNTAATFDGQPADEPDLDGGGGAHFLSLWQIINLRIDATYLTMGDYAELSRWLTSIENTKPFWFASEDQSDNSARIDRLASYTKFRARTALGRDDYLILRKPDTGELDANEFPQDIRAAVKPVGHERLASAVAAYRYIAASSAREHDRVHQLEQDLGTVPDLSPGARPLSPRPDQAADECSKPDHVLPETSRTLRFGKIDPLGQALERIVRTSVSAASAAGQARQLGSEVTSAALHEPKLVESLRQVACGLESTLEMLEETSPEISAPSLKPGEEDYLRREIDTIHAATRNQEFQVGRAIEAIRAIKAKPAPGDSEVYVAATEAILEAAHSVGGMDLRSPPNRSIEDYLADLDSAIKNIDDLKEREKANQELANGVCDSARRYRAALWSVEQAQDIEGLKTKAVEVFKKLQEVASLQRLQSDLEQEAAELELQAKTRGVELAAKQVKIAQRALAVQKLSLATLQQAMVQAQETITEAKKTFGEFAKTLDDDVKEIRKNKDSIFSVLFAIIDVVAAIAAPFTGGISTAVLAGTRAAKAAVRLVEEATRPGGPNWPTIFDAAGTGVDMSQLLTQTRFPEDVSKILRDSSALFSRTSEVSAKLQSIRRELAEPESLSSIVTLASIGLNPVDTKRFEALAAGVKTFRIPSQLKEGMNALVRAGGAFRSPAFEDREIDSWTSNNFLKELNNQFEQFAAPQGNKDRFRTALEKVREELAKLPTNDRDEFLRTTLTSPVAIVRNRDGEATLVRRDLEADLAKADLDRASHGAIDEIQKLAKAIDDRLKDWGEARSRLLKDGASDEAERQIRKLAEQVRDAIKKDGWLDQQLNDLQKKIEAEKETVRNKKEELELRLGESDIAVTLQDRAKKLLESAKIGVQIAKHNEEAASLQLAIAIEDKARAARLRWWAGIAAAEEEFDLRRAIRRFEDQSDLNASQRDDFMSKVRKSNWPEKKDGTDFNEQQTTFYTTCKAEADRLRSRGDRPNPKLVRAIEGLIRWGWLVTRSKESIEPMIDRLRACLKEPHKCHNFRSQLEEDLKKIVCGSSCNSHMVRPVAIEDARINNDTVTLTRHGRTPTLLIDFHWVRNAGTRAFEIETSGRGLFAPIEFYLDLRRVDSEDCASLADVNIRPKKFWVQRKGCAPNSSGSSRDCKKLEVPAQAVAPKGQSILPDKWLRKDRQFHPTEGSWTYSLHFQDELTDEHLEKMRQCIKISTRFEWLDLSVSNSN